jgi:hypothetical protein
VAQSDFFGLFPRVAGLDRIFIFRVSIIPNVARLVPGHCEERSDAGISRDCFAQFSPRVDRGAGNERL